MPSWWGKSSSKDVKKKQSKENIFDTINRKLNLSCDDKGSNGPISVRKQLTATCSKKGSGSYLHPQPRSTSGPQCQRNLEWSQPHSHPLPIPGSNLSRRASSNAIMDMPTTSGVTLSQPMSKHEALTKKVYPGHVERVPELTSVYHNSHDPSERRFLCPQISLSKNGNRNALKNSSRMRRKDKFPVPDSKNSKEMLSTSISLNNQSYSTSPLGSATLNLWNTPHGAFGCAPDNLSPSKSPIGLFSTEHSPIPSPLMASSEPSSQIQSGSVTPLHQRAAAAALEFPITNYFDDKKQQSYRLPLPPLKISNCNPFPVSYSTASSPVAPRSPGRAETPRTPDSRWKKGRLLGRGTFGHVYLGFNSQNGEMCAMKEVTLFSDDIKSMESAQQLVQEIKLISRLEHPNIVQYYGSDTVDDKLYIYLEYVSGGSIHKLLQDYGPLGETAIRNFTRQILCGLAYLHAKNTVHRDIKGANILVDPNGVVKLADFGMAKHINGQPCPLSLKGSPYWMAPEVIKNSSGCNLSVDIWSLGCTVLEMANGKPPWSQYEGIAAMFKIGNSKELPVIPDELGDHGKDFVKQCLQRNPENRPNAAQLLDHPFIRNAAAPLERPIANHRHPEVPIAITNRVKSLAIDYDKRFSSPDSKAISRRSKSSLRPSNSNNNIQLRNVSCPVSPLTSPPLVSSRLSPSLISSPRNAPGSSSFRIHQRPQLPNISCPVSPLTSPPLVSSRLSPSPISSPHNAPGSSSFRILQHPQKRNISCPVSPLTSTHLEPSRLSHSPISSPPNAPGSSSFRILQNPQPIIYSSPRIYTNNNNLKPSSSWMSHTSISPQRNSFIPGSEFKKLPNGQSAMADQVSRHLYKDDHSNSKMKTSSRF